MNKVKEIIRLKYQKGLSQRDSSRSILIGQSSVSRYLKKVENTGLNWSELKELSEEKLSLLLDLQVVVKKESGQPVPDFQWLTVS